MCIVGELDAKVIYNEAEGDWTPDMMPEPWSVLAWEVPFFG
jgi:hypothetical protein